MGLLDGISDPEMMATVGERQALVEHLARFHGWSIEDTRVGLEIADQRAMERFAVGNKIPMGGRH
jgi:hypothetical protein